MKVKIPIGSEKTLPDSLNIDGRIFNTFSKSRLQIGNLFGNSHSWLSEDKKFKIEFSFDQDTEFEETLDAAPFLYQPKLTDFDHKFLKDSEDFHLSKEDIENLGTAKQTKIVKGAPS